MTGPSPLMMIYNKAFWPFQTKLNIRPLPRVEQTNFLRSVPVLQSPSVFALHWALATAPDVKVANIIFIIIRYTTQNEPWKIVQSRLVNYCKGKEKMPSFLPSFWPRPLSISVPAYLKKAGSATLFHAIKFVYITWWIERSWWCDDCPLGTWRSVWPRHLHHLEKFRKIMGNTGTFYCRY